MLCGMPHAHVKFLVAVLTSINCLGKVYQLDQGHLALQSHCHLTFLPAFLFIDRCATINVTLRQRHPCMRLAYTQTNFNKLNCVNLAQVCQHEDVFRLKLPLCRLEKSIDKLA